MASSYVESIVPEPVAQPGHQVVLQTTVPEPAPKPTRLVSLDAYRGFIMLAMASGGLGFAEVAKNFPENKVWQFLGYEFSHVRWTGCAFWDLIQPSFMFMVGVALPYSYYSRRVKGQSYSHIFGHTLVRSFILIALGVFLSSNWSPQTNFTFVNVLCQIGLGYTFVFLLMNRGFGVQLLALLVILLGYGYWFAQFPKPEVDHVYPLFERKYEYLPMFGWFAHWNFDTNPAADFDRWFLNLFPRPKPFDNNDGGYQTLNFIPSMATMIFGLMAGELLRSRTRTPQEKFKFLFLAGALCLVVGLALDYTLCPSVKRIWTPTWAVFSSGWTFWMLAAFYWVIDLKGYQAWSFPLVVVGVNSIAMYCMSQLMKGWVKNSLKTHLDWSWNWLSAQVGLPTGQGIFGGVFGPILSSAAALFILWLVCLWMYRQKVFVRI